MCIRDSSGGVYDPAEEEEEKSVTSFVGMAQNKSTYHDTTTSEKWLIDSGASVHITNDDAKMSKVEEASETIIVGNGSEVRAMKKGTITLRIKGGPLFQLSNVLYVKNFEKILISISKLTGHGATVSADSEKMTLVKGELNIITYKEQ